MILILMGLKIYHISLICKLKHFDNYIVGKYRWCHYSLIVWKCAAISQTDIDQLQRIYYTKLQAYAYIITYMNLMAVTKIYHV